MERAMSQETETLSPETCKELDSAKKPYESGSEPSLVKTQIKPRLQLIPWLELWDTEAENVA